VPDFEIILLLDDTETARALRITPEDLEALAGAGTLPSIYIHSKRRFLLSDVQAFAKTRQS